MKDFSNSSKVLYNYSRRLTGGDIEHFNAAPNKGFFDFENTFDKFIEKFLSHSRKTSSVDSLYLDNVSNLNTIYKNKLTYGNYKGDRKEIEHHISLVNNYIKDINNTKEIFDDLKKINEEINDFKAILDSLKSDEKYSYKYSEKREKVINQKIIDKKQEAKLLRVEINKIIKNYENILESVNKIKEIFHMMDMHADPKFRTNLAQKFIKTQEQKEGLTGAIQAKIVSFLQDKITEDDILDRYSFTKNQKNEEVIIFKDDSIATLKDGKYVTPEIHHEAYKAISEEISRDLASFLLRKKPTYIQPFIKKMAEENYNIEGMYVAVNSFLRYEQILKNYQFDVLGQLKDAKNLEYFDDAIDKVKRKHEINILTNAIFSGKYKELHNNKSAEHLEALYDLKVTKEDLQDNIGKKMAGFKTTADVNEALRKYVNSLNEFNPQALLGKASKFNTQIAYQSEDMVILKINDFEASKALGSGSWCISRHESHFESYAGSKDKLQFFIYDYTQVSNDKNSMIGVTLDINGMHSAAHVKNDDPIYSSNSLFQKLQKIIISNNIEMFKLSEKMKQEMLRPDKETNTKKMKNAL